MDGSSDQAVILKFSGDKVLCGNGYFFRMGISSDPDHLHSVQQCRRDGIGHIGG